MYRKCMIDLFVLYLYLYDEMIKLNLHKLTLICSVFNPCYRSVFDRPDIHSVAMIILFGVSRG